jgi:site-specific DNA-methyltransferase (adenine-specific)
MTSFNLLQGDALEKLKDLPDNSIDLILTDPPYGTTACKWDSIIPFEPMWEHLRRIRKPYAPIIMFSAQPFTTMLINSNISEFKYTLVWEKTKAGNFQQAPNMPLKKHEDIVVFSDGVVGHKTQTKKRMPYNPQGITPTDKLIKRNKYDDAHGYQRLNGIIKGFTQKNENYPESILKFSSTHNPRHPTQKPTNLIEYLVKTYSDDNNCVLDFTMGSGTTGVACANSNRHFIGIELDENYFQIAQHRIEEAYNRPSLENFFT